MHRGPAGAAAALGAALQDAITPTRADLPERNKLVVLVGSTKDIGQAVRVPAPAGATRPWTTASRERSTAEGAQPSDHCTSRRFRPTGQAKLNCRCRRTEFISGSPTER